MIASPPIRCAVVGYGPVFNWGRMHARWMGAVDGLRLVAICDRDAFRVAEAKTDFPAVDTHTDLAEMLRRDDVDLVAVVTPHNTHASVAIECLRAGKHVVVEKPMCISVAEATEMIRAAGRAGRTLAVFHNRRHDGNVRAIEEIIDRGVIGEVFHIEVASTGYGPSQSPSRPGAPWRESKKVSGGCLYDWGAHAVDWVLSMVPSRMTQVTGFSHRLVSPEGANEDQVRAAIRFENGCVAEVLQSRLAFLSKPYLWSVLGTRGAVMDTGRDAIKGYCELLNGPAAGSLTLRTAAGGERQVPYKESDWSTYYADLAAHLLHGAPVPVSAEDGRRVIAVLETAATSAEQGRSRDVPYA